MSSARKDARDASPTFVHFFSCSGWGGGGGGGGEGGAGIE